MGILRALLAISVVIAHSSKIFGFELVGGMVAVKAFFIISGFYMTLILNEKYIGENNSYKLFITNRLLRLYPIYWTILLFTILASVIEYISTSGNSFGKIQQYIDNINYMNISTILFLVVSNIIVLFQDTIMFLGLNVKSGGLFFTTNFNHTNPVLHGFLLVPQAWTLGLEMTFYLIAPFIVRQKKIFIYSLIIFSALLRIVLYKNGLSHDPWSYRFFPLELLFFLLGSIAYYTYAKIKFLEIKVVYLKMIYIFILLFTLFYSFIPYSFKNLAYLLLFFLSVPFIFLLSKKWGKDRYIGELSYPIYISHILVLKSVVFFKIELFGGFGLTVTILTIVFSVLLNEFIARKIEIIRQHRVAVVAKN